MLKKWKCKKCGKIEYLKYKTFWYRKNLGTGMCRSCASLGNNNGFSKGFTPWNKGLKGFLSGNKHYNWQNKRNERITNHYLRNSSEAKKWKREVFKRDSFRCLDCGSNKKLNAHHIMPFKDYPEKRLDINNGVTLCSKCHKRTYHKEIQMSKIYYSLITQYYVQF